MARLCRTNGPLLVGLPDGVDGVKLLWAICGKETSYGQNCVPRHEKAYCLGGRYYQKASDQEWGCASHMSYGPWQVMHANTPTADPVKLLTSPTICADFMVMAMNRMLKAQQPPTLEAIADMWNSGNWRDAAVPVDYISWVVKAYAEAASTLVNAAPAE